MRQSLWTRAKRQLRRALVRAGRAAAPAQSPEAILYASPYRLCEKLHVPGCKFLHTQENVTPDFELFDLTRTAAPNDSRNRHTSHTVGPIAPIADAAGVLREKTKFCAFVFSNPHCATRNRFSEILSHQMHVEAAGRLLSGSSAAPPRVDNFVFTVIEFYRPFKFVVAFENSLSLHYASEKLWTAIHAKTVPIYWGNPHMVTYFNPERFINAFDFDNLESLARHVMRVHENDALYLRYLSAPNTTPRQEHPRFRRRESSKRTRILEGQFRKKRKRLRDNRALSLAQRRMFHRECLSRFAAGECDRIIKDRLKLAGWGGSRVFATSRWHVWPHQALYEDADMAGQLDAKD